MLRTTIRVMSFVAAYTLAPLGEQVGAADVQPVEQGADSLFQCARVEADTGGLTAPERVETLGRSGFSLSD